MAGARFTHLFTPLTIRSITVRNRIVVPGHGTLFMPMDGLPTERILHYWLSKARGGVGLITTHFHNVLPSHTGAPPTAFQSDAVIPAYRRVADALHAEGAMFFVQMNPGGASNSRLYGGVVMSPSPVITKREPLMPTRPETPHEMELKDIRAAVDAMRAASQRAREAGFDGVEIQGEVGLLIAQFMSPGRNRRQDEYGGSLDNRLRFAREVIAAVREGMGEDRVVGIRLSGNEFMENGLTLDDLLETAPRLEATGNLDFIHVGAGPGGGAHVPPSYYRPGSLAYMTEAVRGVVKLPLLCSQRINDPLIAEELLARGIADLIAMNRAIMTDPEMPRKAQEGRLEEIRHCIGCNECIGRTRVFMPAACTMNPEMGREEEMALAPAEKMKRVVIVGGGPAGLEAARVAALRGHQVTVYDKGDRLGGQPLIASVAPGREELDEVRRYYTHQMLLLEVGVHLNTDVTPETLEREGCDAVVIATGSGPMLPDIPVSDGAGMTDVRAVLTGEVQVEAGQRVVVVAGEQHIQALSTAEFLADKGCVVEVLTEALYAGAQLDPGTIEVLYGRLLRKDVTITPLTAVRGVNGRQVVTSNTLTRRESTIEDVDLVVAAYSGQASDSLYHAVKDRVGEVHLVGDALSPRWLMDAILDGARVGRQL